MKQRKQWISVICILAMLFATIPILESNTVSHAAGTLSSGLYYIKNNYSGKYLCPEFESIENGANVWQRTKTSPYWAMVLWKVTDVGNGYYTIRPYVKSDRGLYFPGEAMDVTLPCIGETTPSNANAKWLIQSTTGEYAIRADSSSYNYLSLRSGTTTEGAIVATRPNIDASWQRWTFEATSPSDGILFYQYGTGQFISNPTVYLQPDRLSTPGEVGIVPIVCSYSTNCQDVTYSSTSSGVLPYPNGSIYGYSNSTATITVRSSAISSISASFSAIVLPIADGNYFVSNRGDNTLLDLKKTYTGAQSIMPSITESTKGARTQRCKIHHIGNGYYTICVTLRISVSAGENVYYNYYLCANSDNSVVWKTNPASNEKKWKIMFTSQGSYKITPYEKTTYALKKDFADSSNTSSNVLIAAYTSNTDYFDEWRLNEVKVEINVCYDSSIWGTDYVYDMVGAVSFANRFYNSKFNLPIQLNGEPVYLNYTPINDCLRGVNNTCSVSQCGDNCLNHHKNINHMVDWILNIPRTEGQINILLSDLPNVYCDYVANEPTHILATEEENYAFTSAGDPAILITEIITGDPFDSSNPDYIHPTLSQIAAEESAYIAITTAHEISHVYGTPDRYIYNVQGEYVTHGNHCIMDFPKVKIDGFLYTYNSILNSNNCSQGLCNMCSYYYERSVMEYWK